MKKRIDYRHIICVMITLAFISVSVFVFRNSIGRIIEGGRDLGLSAAYYFCELFGIDYGFTPTVTQLPKYPFFEDYSVNSPTSTLPATWTGFQSKWSEYWRLWASKANIIGYLGALGKVLYYICYIVLLAGVPLGILIFLIVRWQLKKFNNDYAKETKALKIFKRISDVTYRPAKVWIKSFIDFVMHHKSYWMIWACLWAYNFNLFTVLLEFIAYYLYFVFSFDVASLYIQIYKLGLDLWTAIDFIPVPVWVIIGIIVLNAVSIRIGYKRLYQNERRNCAFLDKRGVVNTIYGYVGSGKTTLATDMALSYEVRMLNDALDILIEIDLHYPAFPFINLENALKEVLKEGTVNNIFQCRIWIRRKRTVFETDNCRENIFGYDYERYGLTYNNKLYVQNIWEALEDYACAYMIYTVQSSYIISNYSIRSDKQVSDLGNFPLWDTDFFKRDSRLVDTGSRYSHILDFDMLRLGKKMLATNPNRNAFGFGVYVISEADKERKNQVELKEVKKSDEKCNQLNDLFNACLKMSRHACVVANRVFVHIICDLQRTGSLNSDMLELGDILEVHTVKECKTVLPFYSPFYILAVIHDVLKSKFITPYLNYRWIRSDTTLFMYIIKSIVAKLEKYHDGVTNLFGSEMVSLRTERGFKDGEVDESKWFRMPKKVYSKRFSTACLSGLFEARSILSKVSIEDLTEYGDVMATQEELLKQHSHFQTDVNRIAP